MCEELLTFTFALSTIPDDAALELNLSPDSQLLTVGELLDKVFPPDDTEATALVESLDFVENPDLPEIYEEFLRVIEQYRGGLCDLIISDNLGNEINFQAQVRASFPHHRLSSPDKPSPMQLVLRPEYNALDFAAKQGFTGGEPDLPLWLQTCATTYFLDKHEIPFPHLGRLSQDDPLRPALEELGRRGLVQVVEESEKREISPEGRRFIGRLLTETESYIDRYDIFKDVVWDEETGKALFNTGWGEDLRVQVYILERLDPVRTVFLLRLYDGTMDEFVANWKELVADEEFYNFLLEPVVNRNVFPAELLEDIVDEGLALLEAAEAAAREQRMRERVARRVNSQLDCGR